MSKFSAIYKELHSQKDLQIFKNFCVANYTTFHIGGKVKLFVKVNSLFALNKTIQTCYKYKVQWFCIGKGSNLLVSDKTQNIVFIFLDQNFDYCKLNQKTITVGAATTLFNVNAFAVKNSLTGLEWSYGIPGSIGGAVVMNAGCFGGEIKDVVQKVYYTDGYKEFCITNKYINFKYRHSFFVNKPYVITKVVLKLNKGLSENIWLNCLRNFDKKKSLQPYDKPSAGSVFKKTTDFSAPILIEKAGLKGLKIGDAQVSTKHCGFIVNNNKAKSRQVFKLITKIKKTIYKKFGIILHTEILIIGEK